MIDSALAVGVCECRHLRARPLLLLARTRLEAPSLASTLQEKKRPNAECPEQKSCAGARTRTEDTYQSLPRPSGRSRCRCWRPRCRRRPGCTAEERPTAVVGGREDRRMGDSVTVLCARTNMHLTEAFLPKPLQGKPRRCRFGEVYDNIHRGKRLASNIRPSRP